MITFQTKSQLLFWNTKKVRQKLFIPIILLGFLYVLINTNPANAYPIEPVSLRKLYLRSDLIVEARVKKVETLFFDEESDDSVSQSKEDRLAKLQRISQRTFDTKVTLEVYSILKGKVQSDYIEVNYLAAITCPSPPHYSEGRMVFAFLALSSDNQSYRTVALSYGTQYLKEDYEEIYLKRIEELEDISQIKDPQEKLKQTTSWLVRCIEHEATRRHGLLDLTPKVIRTRTGKVKANKMEKDPALEDFIPRLTQEHLNRLMQVVRLEMKKTKKRDTSSVEKILLIIAHATKDKKMVQQLGDFDSRKMNLNDYIDKVEVKLKNKKG